jgi:hypothetical protein
MAFVSYFCSVQWHETAILLKSILFWDMIRYSGVDIHQHFGGTYFIFRVKELTKQTSSKKQASSISLTLKMEAVYLSRKSVNFYQTHSRVGRVNFCWSSLAQSSLVPSSTGLMTIFYCLTTLGVMKLSSPLGRLGKFLLVLASTIILGSEFHGTHDHILLSHDSGSHATLSLPRLGWVNCCWPLPAQSFLVLSPTGLMTIFYCLSPHPLGPIGPPSIPSRRTA